MTHTSFNEGHQWPGEYGTGLSENIGQLSGSTLIIKQACLCIAWSWWQPAVVFSRMIENFDFCFFHFASPSFRRLSSNHHERGQNWCTRPVDKFVNLFFKHVELHRKKTSDLQAMFAPHSSQTKAWTMQNLSQRVTVTSFRYISISVPKTNGPNNTPWYLIWVTLLQMQSNKSTKERHNYCARVKIKLRALCAHSGSSCEYEHPTFWGLPPKTSLPRPCTVRIPHALPAKQASHTSKFQT